MLIHKQTNDQWVTSQGQIEKLWACADPEFFPGMEGGPKKMFLPGSWKGPKHMFDILQYEFNELKFSRGTPGHRPPPPILAL